jgi:hypothetical protein
MFHKSGIIVAACQRLIAPIQSLHVSRRPGVPAERVLREILPSPEAHQCGGVTRRKSRRWRPADKVIDAARESTTIHLARHLDVSDQRSTC